MVATTGIHEDESTAKLSLYVPPRKGGAAVLERLRKVAQRRDRSLNYMAVEAILQYLEREEKRA